MFGLRPDDVRWILVETSDRLIPEVRPELSACTACSLRDRGVELRLNTTTTSCVAGRIRFGAGRLADNLVAELRGERRHPPRPYRHRFIGSLTELEQPRSSLQATARGAVAGISGV